METTTEDRILDAATSLLVQDGINALTVRSIAEHAGMSTIGIYRKFGNKEGILDEICRQGWNRLSAGILVCDTKQARAGVVHGLVDAYLDVAFSYPAHYQLMFEASTRGYHPSEGAKQLAQKVFRQLVQHVGHVPDLTIDPEMAATELLGLAHGLLSLGMHPSYDVLKTTEWREQILDACLAHMRGRTRWQKG